MNRTAEFKAEACAVIDREHEELLRLLYALSDAVERQVTAPEVTRLLEDLIAYSESHFMSEELLMSMKSYDDYEDHQNDHVDMLTSMQSMATEHEAGRTVLIPGKVHEVHGFITRHIATWDKRLVDFLSFSQ